MYQQKIAEQIPEKLDAMNVSNCDYTNSVEGKGFLLKGIFLTVFKVWTKIRL